MSTWRFNLSLTAIRLDFQRLAVFALARLDANDFGVPDLTEALPVEVGGDSYDSELLITMGDPVSGAAAAAAARGARRMAVDLRERVSAKAQGTRRQSHPVPAPEAAGATFAEVGHKRAPRNVTARAGVREARAHAELDQCALRADTDSLVCDIDKVHPQLNLLSTCTCSG